MIKSLGTAIALMGLNISVNANVAPHVPGQLIVKFKGSIPKSLSGVGLNKVNKLSTSRFALIDFQNKKRSLESYRRELESRADVEFAEPNYIYTVGQPHRAFFPPHKSYSAAATNDPRFDDLWGLLNTGSNDPSSNIPGVVGADAAVVPAWSLTKGDRRIKIAVIDTGVDYNHEDLRDNMWVNTAEKNGTPGVDDDGNGYVDDIYGYDFANDDGDPMDGNGHGTHCAGTIGAVHDNALGVAGVMGDVSMIGLKFLTDQGSGTTANAIKAIEYAIVADVDIMSNSWGGGGASEALKQEIEKASQRGILFVAAAGNSGTNNDTRPQYPANYEVDNVISVASHTSADRLSGFSCYGRNTVHVAAPGQNVLSTYPNNQYAILSGTSMATPHVSGALGLLLAYEGNLGLLDIKERLMATSEPKTSYRSRLISGGRLHTGNLLNDERPVRNNPDANAWQTKSLSTVFESDHPYDNNQELKRTITVPGAKFVRVVIKEFEFEERYDYLMIADANGEEIERVTLKGNDYVSDYVEGDTVKLTFRSDRSINFWGFRIEEVQFQ